MGRVSGNWKQAAGLQTSIVWLFLRFFIFIGFLIPFLSMAEAVQIYPGGAFQGSDDSVATMGTITVSPYNVLFEGDGLLLNFPSHALALDLDAETERVLISHPNYPGWQIYSLDPAILEDRCLQRFNLKERLERLKYQRAGPSRHVRQVYMALGGLILLLFICWAFTDTVLGMVVAAMPSEVERQVGKAAFSEISDEYEITHEPALTNRLFLVTERLKKGLPADAPKFHFFVADDDMVNAFALPGGNVIVMRGLIESSEPDELAGVLSHEMAHVIGKHGMRQIAQTIGPLLIAEFLFSRNSAVAALTAGGAEFGSLSYSREHETQADENGWEILVRANIDPRAMTRFFRKIQNMEGDQAEEVLSTHPATSARIERLEEKWATSFKKSGFQPVDGGPPLKKEAK